MPKTQSKIIHTNGINLHVLQAGPEDGPLVILLHGFPEFWYGWHKQIDYLADLGLRVWVPDQRGYNLSDKPQGVKSYQMHHLVEDVLGLIRAAGEQSAMIVGHDWGAMVAWWTALNYPERVTRLGILNVPHPHIMKTTLRQNFRQMRKSWYVGMFQIPWLPEKLMGFNDWNLIKLGMQKSARRGSFTDDDMQQYLEAWSRPGTMTSMMNWYRAYVRNLPNPPETWRVTSPTMMIWGERDIFLDQSMAQPSINLCDNGSLHMIKKATHWVQHDAADEVNRLLGEFLR